MFGKGGSPAMLRSSCTISALRREVTPPVLGETGRRWVLMYSRSSVTLVSKVNSAISSTFQPVSAETCFGVIKACAGVIGVVVMPGVGPFGSSSSSSVSSGVRSPSELEADWSCTSNDSATDPLEAD